MDTPAAEHNTSVLINRGTGWRRQILRYGFHLLAAYLTLHFATESLTGWIHYILSVLRPQWQNINPIQFLMSNLLLFSSLPAFLAAFLMNAKLQHRAAIFVWIVPAIVFAYSFVFHSPGIYPTIPLESELRPALHHWFGGGFKIVNREAYTQDVYRIYHQLTFTALVYAGAAYSLGAWLAMKFRFPALDAFLVKW
jgi:hypothetical protein